MGKKYPLKLDKTEKLIHIFAEIIEQKKKFGENIPIKAIKKVFSEDIHYGISSKDVDEAINKIESTGQISFSKGGKSIETLW